MTVQHGNRILRFGKTAFETLYRLRRERNFRNQHDRGVPAIERRPNGLQINFSLAGPGHAVEQNRAPVFRRLERRGDFLEGAGWFLGKDAIARWDELFRSMR